MSAGNRQRKLLPYAPPSGYVYFSAPAFTALALLTLLFVIFIISSRRQQLVNQEMLALMRDQLDELKADENDIAELVSAVEALGPADEDGDLESRENALRITGSERIAALEERLGSRLDNLERLIFNRGELDNYQLSREYAELGRIGEQEGDYGQASDHYRESLEYRESPDVLFAYAQSLYRADPELRDDEQIIRNLKSVLAQDPVHIDALNLLDNLYLERGSPR